MVTPTEKAKRSEALYYDNHNITRRTLCDRVVNLESDMEEIKAENAKLVKVLHEVEREAVHAYKCLQKDCETITGSSSHHFDKWWHAECQNDRLKAENVKLRELLRIVVNKYCDSGTCDGCPILGKDESCPY